MRRAASFDLFSDFCVPHSQVEVAVVLHEVHDVDEINFSFKAKFTVYFTWTDIGMWKGLTDFAG